MSYEELYNQAISGNTISLEELVDYAEKGEADAQYYLACYYETDNPHKNEAQAFYWLEIASYNGNQRAKQKLKTKTLIHHKNLYDEDISSLDRLPDGNENIQKDKENDKTERNGVTLWPWLLFLILFSANLIYKCEKKELADEQIQNYLESLQHIGDRRSDNPFYEMKSDSNLRIDPSKFREDIKKNFSK